MWVLPTPLAPLKSFGRNYRMFVCFSLCIFPCASSLRSLLMLLRMYCSKLSYFSAAFLYVLLALFGPSQPSEIYFIACLLDARLMAVNIRRRSGKGVQSSIYSVQNTPPHKASTCALSSRALATALRCSEFKCISYILINPSALYSRPCSSANFFTMGTI